MRPSRSPLAKTYVVVRCSPLGERTSAPRTRTVLRIHGIAIAMPLLPTAGKIRCAQTGQRPVSRGLVPMCCRMTARGCPGRGRHIIGPPGEERLTVGGGSPYRSPYGSCFLRRMRLFVGVSELG